MKSSRSVLIAAIVVYFVIALEVLIMISPFAGFFYAAFDPDSPVVCPMARDAVVGRVLSAAHGLAARAASPGYPCRRVCPLPGWRHRLLHLRRASVFQQDRPPWAGDWWPVSVDPPPQYLSLAVCGLSLAVLWPRFLTIVLWTVMVGLYYLLAKDEERRMVSQFGDRYREYLARTGMFVPSGLDAPCGDSSVSNRLGSVR